MTETQVHLDAFELYYSLKAERSYKRVAEKTGVTVANVGVWGKSFNWQQRVVERDKEIASRVIEKNIAEEVNTRVLLDIATTESVKKYIHMLDKLESLDIDTVKVLDILGRLHKELKEDDYEDTKGNTGITLNLNFNKDGKPEDYQEEEYEED